MTTGHGTIPRCPFRPRSRTPSGTFFSVSFGRILGQCDAPTGCPGLATSSLDGVDCIRGLAMRMRDARVRGPKSRIQSCPPRGGSNLKSWLSGSKAQVPSSGAISMSLGTDTRFEYVCTQKILHLKCDITSRNSTKSERPRFRDLSSLVLCTSYYFFSSLSFASRISRSSSSSFSLYFSS